MPRARKSAGPYEFLPVALWTPRRDEAIRDVDDLITALRALSA